MREWMVPSAGHVKVKEPYRGDFAAGHPVLWKSLQFIF